MPTPSTRTPVRIARGSYSNLNGSVSDLQDGEISYAEDQDKLYIKEGGSLVALTYTPANPTFTGTVTIPTPTAGDNSTKAASTAFVVAGFAPKADPAFTGTATGVNLTLSGNLTVNGTTTTIDTTNLDVEDRNITIGKVSTPSDATADGGGITLKGATDKKITWNTTQNAWLFNKDVTVESGVLTVKGTESGNANIYLFADEADDDADYWKIQALASDNTLIFQNKTTGSYTTTLKLNPNGALEDSKGDVRKIPQQNEQGSAHTLVAADAGKHILADATVTAPPTSGIFSAGDAITIINTSGSDISIARGTGVTMYNAADGTNADRTLGTKGMATLLCAGSNTYYISGAGLS